LTQPLQVTTQQPMLDTPHHSMSQDQDPSGNPSSMPGVSPTMKRRNSKRKSAKVSPQSKQTQAHLSAKAVSPQPQMFDKAISPQPQMSTRMLSPQPQSSFFQFTEVDDTGEEQYEEDYLNPSDLLVAGSNDKAVQVEILKSRHHPEIHIQENDDVVDVVEQASKLEASIENSTILNLQNQTDQLQGIIGHIDLELGRLKDLIQDIAVARRNQPDTSK